jgi:hypothetical protein
MHDDPRRFRLMLVLRTLAIGMLVIVLFVNWK